MVNKRLYHIAVCIPLLAPICLSAQYNGGSGEGTDQIALDNSLLNGNNSAIVFSGGNADGFDQTFTTNSLLNGSNQSILFSGGDADGFDQKITTNSLLNGTSSILFSGGDSDGFDQIISTNNLLNGGNSSILFSGGNADGFDQTITTNSFLGGSNVSILFSGGDSDGFDQTTTVNNLLNGSNSSILYSGGDGDGYDDLGESLITLNGTHRPGSGKAIAFNGINQLVNVGDDTSLDLTDGTIEFWFKPDWVAGSLGENATIVGKQSFSDRRYSIIVTDDLDAIGLHNGSTFGSLAVNFEQGEWYHVAVVDFGSNSAMVVNGIYLGDTGNAFGTTTGLSFAIASRAGSTEFFEGEIDEVRVWNTALSLTRIREWMNVKVTSSHPDYANLVGYWRFDEGTGSATKNWAGGNDGNIFTSTWTTSGASLGDQSVWDFSSPTSLSLNVTGGGELTVDITGGTADGIQIYYIGESPADVTAPAGFSDVDVKYFGVFMTGTNPVYTVTYDYSGNTAVTNESAIQLAFRSNNADTWADLSGTVDTNANTITQTGQTGTEFIVGGTSEPLPITLLSFTADVTGPSEVLLYWRTANEINNDYFLLERSGDGVLFKTIGNVSGSGNSSEVKEYQYIDRQASIGMNYYRLTQFDFDGNSEISKIIAVEIKLSNRYIYVYPNPTESQLNVLFHSEVSNKITFELVNLEGKKYSLKPRYHQGLEYVFQLNNLSPGVYILAINVKKEVVYHRVMVE